MEYGRQIVDIRDGAPTLYHNVPAGRATCDSLLESLNRRNPYSVSDKEGCIIRHSRQCQFPIGSPLIQKCVEHKATLTDALLKFWGYIVITLSGRGMVFRNDK